MELEDRQITPHDRDKTLEFNLALVQMKVVAEKESNVENAIKLIKTAKEKGADVIALPVSCISKATIVSENICVLFKFIQKYAK